MGQKTALYDRHRALGAKIVDFAGWEMPLQYKGIIHEHQVVRTKVGIFDVSHMGRIFVEGLMAEELLDLLSTNSISGRHDGSVVYTVWCKENGTCIDDLLIYRMSPTKFFIVVNAGNREKDLEHLLHFAVSRDVFVKDAYDTDGILAVQGPDAVELVSRLFPKAAHLKPMTFIVVNYEGDEVVISSTGYTGAGGVEIYAPNDATVKIWDALFKLGKDLGVEPIGLGARDTLRLEMGYALYGHELTDATLANETIAAWTVKWDKLNFLGKHAMEPLQTSGKKRKAYGIVLTEQGIARQGCPLLLKGKKVGVVTSGSHSPILNRSIALVLADEPLNIGDEISVQIRQNNVKGQVVNLPFIGTVAKG